jgi:osmotically inducible lipoprotein OsmB
MQIKTTSRVTMGFVALLALAACGDNTTERAATGAATGAVVAGPAGALVGGAIGTVVE